MSNIPTIVDDLGLGIDSAPLLANALRDKPLTHLLSFIDCVNGPVECRDSEQLSPYSDEQLRAIATRLSVLTLSFD